MNVTNRERIKFMETIAEILHKFSKGMDNFHEECSGIAKDINVASAYRIQNLAGEMASNTATSAHTINSSALEAIITLGKTDYNGGEYTEQINAAVASIEGLIPAAYDVAKVPESADGNENLQDSVVSKLDDCLSHYGQLSRSSLLEVSDAASKVHGDDHVLIKNLGQAVETLTNNIISTNNKISEQVSAMVSEYKITLAHLDEITSGLASKVDTMATPDISMGSGSF